MVIQIFTLILSIHSLLSLQNFQTDNTQQRKSSINSNFPGNYTLREIINTEFVAFNVLLSPDQNWVFYQNQNEPNSTTFYFRRRRSSEINSVKLGNDKFDFLMDWKFNNKGNLLFIGTYFGYIYLCKFSQNMTIQKCQKSFQFNTTADTYSLSVNKANQLAVATKNIFYVLAITESGQLVEVAQTFFTFPGLSVSWDPQHQDIVIIGTCTSQIFRQGLIRFFNITSNLSTDRNVSICVEHITLFNNEKIILTLSTSQMLNAFTYDEGTNLTSIGITNDIRFRQIRLSANGSFLIGYQYNEFQAQVYQVVKLVSPLGYNPSGESNEANSITGISLDLVYSQGTINQCLYSFSKDGNQYIFSDRYYAQIQVYSMCSPGTYYAAVGCFKCSTNCSACHFASDTCTDCLNNTFALFNGTCLSCSIYLTGCLTCSNVHSCLSCDEKYNFSPNPANGSCICKDFYFLSNGKCELCQPYTACRVCASETVCTECDLYKGYKQKPVDSLCVCRREFSTVNNTCVECDIEGCERCENVNVCMLCLQSQGYEPDVGMDGICVKKSSYSLVIILSIIGGCVLIGIAIYVYCMLRKRKQDAKYELKEAPDFEEKASESSEIHRMSAPKFEEIEQMIKQSFQGSIKAEKIQVINKKEYAKFSDAQKIQLGQLLKESLL